MIYKTLEFHESEQMEDVLAGTFTYKQKDGEDVEAKFFVRCCVLDPTDDDSRGRRADAVNEQLTEQWEALMLTQCTCIHYQEVRPNPFF